MPRQGRLTDWNDDRGFGYIKPLDGGPTVFVHISEFPSDQRRPYVTDLLTYDLGADDRGRIRAINVRFLSAAHARSSGRESASTVPMSTQPLVMPGAFVAIVALASLVGALAWWVPFTYLGMSVLTFAAYAGDKRAAQAGEWRTSESALILLGLLCGWPGGLAARRILRHKTRKQPFRAFFWASAVTNVIMLVVLATTMQSLIIS